MLESFELAILFSVSMGLRAGTWDIVIPIVEIDR